MEYLRLALATTILTAAAFPSLANELRAIEAYPLHLGPVIGTVYYDAANGTDRLVATLSTGPESTPVRMITTLADGQSATVSVPQAVGQSALEVTFVRRGDHVFATDSETVVGSIR